MKSWENLSVDAQRRVDESWYKKDKINFFFFFLTDESSLPIEQSGEISHSEVVHITVHVCFLKGVLTVCAVIPIFDFANNPK